MRVGHHGLTFRFSRRHHNSLCVMLIVRITLIGFWPLAARAFSLGTPPKTNRGSRTLGSSIPQQEYGFAKTQHEQNVRYTAQEKETFQQESSPNSMVSTQQQVWLPGGITPKALGWTIAIVLLLAESIVEPSDVHNPVEVGYNIVDAAVPLTPQDLVAVTIGEVTAGALAPFISLAVVSLVARPLLTTRNNLGQAVADADFLVARAASMPLLIGLGIPPGLSKALGGFLALLPSQVVKSAARSRDEWVREELERELEEETSHQFKFPIPFQREEEPEMNKIERSLAIEIFSDLLKWLSYGVMCVKWEAALAPLSHVQECAIYGLLANVGSQAYTDLMGRYLLGDVERQNIQSRSLDEWKSIYLSQAICGATLFGLYEGVQEPATRIVSHFLEG